MSVSQARCLLKGASGHLLPRRAVFVVLLRGGGGRVRFCEGMSMIEEVPGERERERESVRAVAMSAESGGLVETVILILIVTPYRCQYR